MIDRISVVICCYNSSKTISKTIQSLIKQSLDYEYYEIIIVDNNCIDNTLTLVTNALKNTNIVYSIIKENKQGLIYARKSALDYVNNQITVFVDDDNILEQDYLIKVLRTFRERKKVGVIGANICPLVDNDLPKWFFKYQSVFACGPLESKSSDLTSSRVTMFGAGLSFRTHILKNIMSTYQKPVLVGRTGNILLRGDDSELCLRCVLQKWQVWYEHDLHIQHNIESSRISWEYVMKARYGGGIASIILDMYRSQIFSHSIKPHRTTMISVFLEYLSFTFLRNGYWLRNSIGSEQSFRYWYLLGRVKGVISIRRKKYKEIIKEIQKIDIR